MFGFVGCALFPNIHADGVAVTSTIFHHSSCFTMTENPVSWTVFITRFKDCLVLKYWPDRIDVGPMPCRYPILVWLRSFPVDTVVMSIFMSIYQLLFQVSDIFFPQILWKIRCYFSTSFEKITYFTTDILTRKLGSGFIHLSWKNTTMRAAPKHYTNVKHVSTSLLTQK